jgi:hypothetical protein
MYGIPFTYIFCLYVLRPPHYSSPRKVMRGQLIHESVLPVISSSTPRARLPDTIQWCTGDLNSHVERDPYMAGKTLIDKLSAGGLSDIERGILKTLVSSGALFHANIHLILKHEMRRFCKSVYYGRSRCRHKTVHSARSCTQQFRSRFIYTPASHRRLDHCSQCIHRLRISRRIS